MPPVTPAHLPWQATCPGRRPALPSGHEALDARLVDGGWPRGALTELLLAGTGIGELPLLLPALAAGQRAGGWLVLVSPPFVPCIGAWQAAGLVPARLLWLTPPDARGWLWSTEQAARTPGCSVLAWQGRHPAGLRELRRLQLAAAAGDNLVALLRPLAAREQSSVAALRLALTPRPRGELAIEVLKQRGGFGGQALALPLHEARARTRIPPWQLPVHVPAAHGDALSGNAFPDTDMLPDDETLSCVVAGPALPRPAAGALDAQHALPPPGGRH